MRRFLALTRVLLKNGQAQDGKKRKALGMVTTIIVRLIALILVIGIFALLLFTAMAGFPEDKTGQIDAVIHVFTMDVVLVLISGIPLILSYFFLSRDVQLYIHMPFRGREIVGAKLVMAMMTGVVVSIIVGVPQLIGFGVKGGWNALYYAKAVIVSLFIPVIPTLMISVLAIVLMNLLKHMKNKEAVVTIATYAGMAVIILSSMVGNSGDNGFLDGIASNPVAAVAMAVLCPTSQWGARALINEDLMAAGLFFAVNIAAVIIFMFFADAFYMQSALAAGEGKVRKTEVETHLNFQPIPLKTALFQKENAMFFRSPVCVMNSLANMLMIPVVMIITMVTAVVQGNGVTAIFTNAAFLPAITVFLPIILCWLFGMTALMNRMTATSISREGEGYYLLKAMPIKLKMLYQAKKKPGFLISLAVCGIMGLAVSGLLLLTDISVVVSGMILIETISVVLLTNNIQMLYACKEPMLIWDTEETVIRQSRFLSTTLVVNAILMIGTVITGTIFYFGLGAMATAFFWCIWMAAVALATEIIGTQKGIKMLKKIGE